MTVLLKGLQADVLNNVREATVILVVMGHIAGINILYHLEVFCLFVCLMVPKYNIILY